VNGPCRWRCCRRTRWPSTWPARLWSQCTWAGGWDSYRWWLKCEPRFAEQFNLNYTQLIGKHFFEKQHWKDNVNLPPIKINQTLIF
jgi:hypothetical protein